MKVDINSLTGAKLNWAIAQLEEMSPDEYEGEVVIGLDGDGFGGVFYDYQFEPKGTEEHLREALRNKYPFGWVKVPDGPFLRLKGLHEEYVAPPTSSPPISLVPPPLTPSSSPLLSPASPPPLSPSLTTVAVPPPLVALPPLAPLPCGDTDSLPEAFFSEEILEEEIQAKGLDAPRLSPEQINSVIVSKTFTTLPSGKTMICELILRNGFSVRGEASVVSKENFNQEVGEKISFQDARDKIWQLEGYLLQQRLWEESR